MPCMRLRRYSMLSKFEVKEIKSAKSLLEKELENALSQQQALKEKQESKAEKKSLWSRFKSYLEDLF